VSPVIAPIVHNGEELEGSIEWAKQNMDFMDMIDSNRVTEDGAEAVAIAYVYSKAGWVAKRRLQKGESADWLMVNNDSCLALEVSGTISGDLTSRLSEKMKQVVRCSLPVEKLAVVVRFETPSVLAASP